MTFAFTQLSEHSYSEAFQIQTTCHSHPWSEAVFADCLSSPYFSFQMHANDSYKDVVGYYVGLAVAGEATLMDIGVKDSQRGKGYAKLLMQHFLAQCKVNHCNEVWLEVRESNFVAIRLYENFGFQLIEIRKGYYPTESGRENGLIMQLKT
ncbi:MAG: ribosomal protein S18-alanine N-acetyltransferase [Aliiglaciecola sp.]